LLQIGRIGVVLYLISIAANHLIGWNPEALMIALGILTIVYTVLGGIEAVIWTDVVQTLVLLGGGVTAVVLLLTRMPGGAMAGFDMAFENSKFSLGAMDFNFIVGGFWLVFVFGVVDNLRNFGVDQNYVQRFLSARSEREAHKSLWLGGLTFIPVSALFFLIGTLLYAYYGSNDLLPEGIAGDQVFPFFINTELPVGLRGLVIAALLAAGMSTLDSSINVSATVWVVDFYRRILRPDASDRTLLRMTRLATVVIGSLGIAAAIAIFRARNQTVLDVWWAISGIFGGGMLGIFLLGLMVKDSTSRGAAIAVAVGSLVILWAALTNPDKGKLLFDTGWLNYPLHSLTIGPVGAGAIIVVGWLESRVFRSAGRES
jgi:SSS family solute:Na+ symporter